MTQRLPLISAGLLWMAVAWILPCGQVQAEDTIDYPSQIAPILRQHCAGCHNDEDQEAGLSVESFATLQKGIDGQAIFVPGKSSESPILKLIKGEEEPRMPPEDQPGLKPEEIAMIAKWIDQGAVGPTDEKPGRMPLEVPQIASLNQTNPVTAMASSSDGRYLAIGRYQRVEVFARDEADRFEMQEPIATLEAFAGKVTSIDFADSGEQLVVASGVTGLAGEATLVDWKKEQVVTRYEGHRDILYAAKLSPDRQTLATGGYDRQIILWEAATGQELRTLAGHNGAVYDLDFSPDGQFLISGSADETCKVWRVADGQRMDTLPQPLKEVYASRFTPDGKHLVSVGADNSLRVWEFISHDRPRVNPMVVARYAHEAPVLGFTFSADGKLLVTTAQDKTVKLWDAKSFEEIQLWTDQGEVAMAVALPHGSRHIHLGQMDGTVARLEIPAAAEKEESPAAPPAPTPEARIAADAPLNKVTEDQPNHHWQQAQPVELPAEISGKIHTPDNPQPDEDYFRFTAQAGETWVLEVNAARSQSDLDSIIEVWDDHGRPVPRVLLQAVRESYFTFRGKDNNTVDDFRVFKWEEMGLNQYFYANGEVVKLWHYPRGPDSGFMVYPGQGQRWGYFDTTPLAHALGEPAYIVEPHPPGTPLIPNGLPVFELNYENDDASRRDLGKDSRLFFTAPADGDYIARIRDVRGFEGENFHYRLTIRPPNPDFTPQLLTREVTTPQGSRTEFRVRVDRRDQFDGPVTFELEDLPEDLQVSGPLVVEPGQLEAAGVLWTTAEGEDPPAERKDIGKLIATAQIDGREVRREVPGFKSVKFKADPKLTVQVVPDPEGTQPDAASDDGLLQYTIRPGETIQLMVEIERNGFDSRVSLGNADSGRNLPYGTYVDNIGLNGLLIKEGENQRSFFITADKVTQPQSRLFHLQTTDDGGHASPPIRLNVEATAP